MSLTSVLNEKVCMPMTTALFDPRLLDAFHELLLATLDGERVISINRASMSVLGERPEHLLGSRWLDRVHPDDQQQVAQAHERILQGQGDQQRMFIRMRHASGVYRTIATHAVPIDAQIVALVGRDVTTEQRLSERAAELEMTLEQIHEVARVGGWRVGWETGDVWWSDVTRELCEAEPGFEPTLEVALAMYPEEVRDTLRERLERSVRSGEEWELELPFYTLRGKLRRVFARGKAHRDAHGKLQLIGTFQDVTERYEMEQRLRRFERMQSLGMLAGGVAHDINNLTSVIMGNTTLLLDDAPRPEQIDLLDDIQASTQHIRHITQQLLDFTGARRTTPTRFALAPLLQETARELRPLLAAQMKLPIEVTPPDLVVYADRTQLRQMLENLILNAAHADATHISLRACVYQSDLSAATCAQTPIGVPEADRPWLMIEVDDNGRGMTPEVLQRAFDPFFTTRSRGHGLGLATVLGTLQAHHGRLIVTSTPGEGARFVLCLPPAP